MQELQYLWHVGSAVEVPRLERTGSTAVGHGLSWSVTCGIFLDQGSNLCLLHWEVDSLPLSHQRRLYYCFSTDTYCSLRKWSLSESSDVVATSHLSLLSAWKLASPNWDVQFSSVAQSCPTLCNLMNRSTPGLPVHHQLPESTQTHVHGVGDAIQPSHPLSSPSSPALNLSQHQGLCTWVSSLHQMAKLLEFQLQHQSFQWTPRTDLL